MKYLLSLLLIYCAFQAMAQNDYRMNFQANLTDLEGQNISGSNIVLDIAILEGAVDGSLVFSESHNIQTTSKGLINLEIGSINDLSSVSWSSGSYYLQLSVDQMVISTTQLLSVPYALHANMVSETETLDYNDLENQPTTISTEQANKIDLLQVSSGTDLDSLLMDIAANSLKLSFPGFGNTTETGYNIQWSKINNELFRSTGSVGIDEGTLPNFGGAVLKVGGAILFEGGSSVLNPGQINYDAAGTGFFRLVNNDMEVKGLGTGDLTINMGNLTGNGDYQILSDFLTKKIGVGNGLTPGYDFGENSMAFGSGVIRIRFDDTSLSSFFPRNDWDIVINDELDGGANYFAIEDVTSIQTPFYIAAGAPDNSIFIGPSGNIGMGTNNPGSELQVNGSIKASNWIGDVSGLTGISTGTSNVDNTGSTTVGADNDASGDGDVLLQTKNANQVTIKSGGNLGIGTETPLANLDVNGTAKFNSSISVRNLSPITIPLTITNDLTASGFYTLDVSNKEFITFNPTGSLFLNGFTNGTNGQKVTIMNLSPTATVTGFTFPSIPALGQFESATLIFTGPDTYVVMDVVDVP